MRRTPLPRVLRRCLLLTALACRCTTWMRLKPVVSSDELNGEREDALALAFTRRYQRDWRYVAGWGRWLVGWQRWRTEDTLAANRSDP